MLEIVNFTKTSIDKRSLKKIAEIVLKEEGVKGDLSLFFVGKKRMRDLNKKHRGKDYATDVLSFAFDKGFVIGDKNLVKLGEIIICVQCVEDDLAPVLIHGILHILGYNHKTMSKLEETYLCLVK